MQAVSPRTAEPRAGPVTASLPLSSASAATPWFQSSFSRPGQRARRLDDISEDVHSRTRRGTVVYHQDSTPQPGPSCTDPSITPAHSPRAWPDPSAPWMGTTARLAAAAPRRTTTTTTSTRHREDVSAPAVHRAPATWHTLTQDRRDTAAYAARQQHAAALLADFDAYQRSVGGALPTRAGLPTSSPSAACAPTRLLSGGGRDGRGDGEVRSRPRLDLEALQQDRPRTPAAAGPASASAARVHATTSPTKPHAAAAAAAATAIDAAALGESKRRALQVLYHNAQARAGFLVHGMQLSRAVYVEMLKGEPIDERTAPPPSTTMLLPPHPADTRATAPPTAPVSAASVTPAAPAPCMTAAEKAAATSEAERALTLLYAIRAMRRQTEDLTVSLLHAYGAWGCWGAPDLPAPSKTSQLFADLFLATTPAPAACLTGDALGGGAAPANGHGAEGDATATAAAAFMANQVAGQRRRACAALRVALERQQARWSTPADASGPTCGGDTLHAAAAAAAAPAPASSPPAAAVAFLELAAAPPQRAVPPPPPTAVQLDLFASQQSALHRTIAHWRTPHASTGALPHPQDSGEDGADSAAAAAAAVMRTNHTTGAVQMPYAAMQDELYRLRAQRQELQQAFDKLQHVAGVPPPMPAPPPSSQPTDVTAAAAAAAAAVRGGRGVQDAQSSASCAAEVAARMDSVAEASVPVSVAASVSPPRQPAAAAAAPRADHASVNTASDTPPSSPLQLTIDKTRPWVDSAVDASAVVSPSPSPPHRGARVAARQHGTAAPTSLSRLPPAAAGGAARGSGAAAPAKAMSSSAASGAMSSALPPNSTSPELTAATGLAAHGVHRVRSTSLASDTLRSSAAPRYSSAASSRSRSRSRSTDDDEGHADVVQQRAKEVHHNGDAHVAPDACAASWLPYTSAMLSTHPAAAAAPITTVSSPTGQAQHTPRTQHVAEPPAATPPEVVVRVADPVVQRQLLQWVLEQQRQQQRRQRQLGMADTSHTSSSSASAAADPARWISALDLDVAATWLRASAQSPALAAGDTRAEPPAAVLRVVALLFPCAPVSLRPVEGSSAAENDTADADAGAAACDARTVDETTMMSDAPGAVPAVASVPSAAQLPSPPPPPPAAATAAADDDTQVSAGNNATAAVAPESVTARRRRKHRSSPPASVHPRLRDRGAPPAPADAARPDDPPPPPSSKLADGGDGAAQRRRGGFLRRLFTCGG